MNFIIPVDVATTGHARYIYDEYGEVVALNQDVENVQIAGILGTKLLCIGDFQSKKVCAEVETEVWSYWVAKSIKANLNKFPEPVRIKADVIYWYPSKRYKNVHARYTKYI